MKSYERAEALVKLAAALTQAQQWKEAQAVIATVPNSYRRAGALADLAAALAQAQRWEQAQAVIPTMESRNERAQALRKLARAMAGAGEDAVLLRVIHRSWRLADNREYALALFPLVTGFIPRNPELGFALHEAFTWVDSFFLKG